MLPNLTFRAFVFGWVSIPIIMKIAYAYHNYNNNMRGLKVPQILRNPHNNSITISHPKPNKTLIWLHGVADQADSYLPFFTHLQSPLHFHTKIILLQAPARFFTLRQTAVNAWFDIKSTQRFAAPEKQVYNLGQLEETFQFIASQCKQEEQYWLQKDAESVINPQHKVYIGGFSQGAVAALHYAMQTNSIPAGVIAANGYLLRHTMLNNLGKLPVLLMHGKQDKTILEGQAKSSYGKLIEGSQLVEYQNYPNLDHTLTVEQLIDMRKWLEKSYSFISQHYSQQKVQNTQ